jgi:hypothetical protein
MLHDMVMWRNSPRIRDRISHGSIDPRMIPTSLIDRTVLIAYTLLQQYNYRLDRVECITYNPVFHPQIPFYRDLEDTCSCMGAFYTDIILPLMSENETMERSDVILNNEMRSQLLEIQQQVEEHLHTRYNHISAFSVSGYFSSKCIDDHVVPYILPKIYHDVVDRAPGTNVSAITSLQRICKDVVASITAVKDALEKARIKNTASLILKYEKSMVPLYQLLVVMMQSIELALLSINSPSSVLLKDLAYLATSLPSSILANTWPRPKVICKFFESLKSEWIETVIVNRKIRASGGEREGECYDATVLETSSDKMYQAVICKGSMISENVKSIPWAEKSRSDLLNDGSLVMCDHHYQLTRDVSLSELKQYGLRIQDQEQVSKFVSGKTRTEKVIWNTVTEEN